MLPTPDTSHLTFDDVYEPSEDSYLLLDALSKPSETAFLHSRLANSATPLVIEVGSGSGVVLAFVAANAAVIFGRPDVLTLGVDVNEAACRATIATVSKNAGPLTLLGTLQADLTGPLKPLGVDLLIFNPPYVPSDAVPQAVLERTSFAQSSSYDKFSHDSHLLALATDGGVDGMEVTGRLLAELTNMLSDRGMAYVLLCAHNRPEAVKQRIRGWECGHGWQWDAETVHTSGKQGGWEKLQIVRICKRWL